MDLWQWRLARYVADAVAASGFRGYLREGSSKDMSELSVLSGVDYANPDTSQGSKTYYGLSPEAWMRIGVLALLMVGLFWPNLRRLWLKTNPITGEANWGHAFFVPLIGLYYLYINRDALLKARVRTSYIGLGIMLLGLLLFAYGIWPGQNDFVKDFAMVVTLFGLVAFMCGWQVMKIAWFPIAFLVCAIPWPGLVYSWVAMPLQQVAAWAAVKLLTITGVEAYREGTKLLVVKGLDVRVLNVEEACAGLKSLMTFIAVGAAVGFLSSRATWQRIVITLSAIPIAVFCNMLRVAGVGIIDHYLTRKLSEGFAHQFVGMILLVPAFFLILLVGWILDNIFIEEADKNALPSPGSRSSFTEIPRNAAPRTPAPAPKAAPQPAAKAAPITAAPITAAPITQAPITKAAPAPITKQPIAKPQPPAAKPVVKPAPAPASPADITAATMRLTSGSLRKPAPPAKPPQAKPAAPQPPAAPKPKQNPSEGK
jgi:exosortase